MLNVTEKKISITKVDRSNAFGLHCEKEPGTTTTTKIFKHIVWMYRNAQTIGNLSLIMLSSPLLFKLMK